MQKLVFMAFVVFAGIVMSGCSVMNALTGTRGDNYHIETRSVEFSPFESIICTVDNKISGGTLDVFSARNGHYVDFCRYTFKNNGKVMYGVKVEAFFNEFMSQDIRSYYNVKIDGMIVFVVDNETMITVPLNRGNTRNTNYYMHSGGSVSRNLDVRGFGGISIDDFEKIVNAKDLKVSVGGNKYLSNNGTFAVQGDGSIAMQKGFMSRLKEYKNVLEQNKTK